MSEEQENHLRGVVRDEIRKGLRWLIGVFGMLVIGLIVKGVQDSTRLNDHIGDGHPRVVLDIVYGQAVSLGKIEANQERILSDMEVVKKGVLESK